MSDYHDIPSFFKHLDRHFDADLAGETAARIVLILTGDQASDWSLTVENKQLNVHEGRQAPADVTMTLDAQDWLDLANGKAQAPALFMMGKIKIEGDMQIAIQMASWFKRHD